MKKFENRFILLLLNFDQDEERFNRIKTEIPDEVKARVFIPGTFSESEYLKKTIDKTFEEIGDSLAEECANDNYQLWQHELLKHNSLELERMISSVKPFLFSKN